MMQGWRCQGLSHWKRGGAKIETAGNVVCDAVVLLCFVLFCFCDCFCECWLSGMLFLFLFAFAWQARTALFFCVFIKLADFDDGAASVFVLFSPEGLCVIKELCCINVGHNIVTHKADVLQCIQNKLHTIVNVWCFGHKCGSNWWKHKLLGLLVEHKMLFWTREEEPHCDMHWTTWLVCQDGGLGSLSCFGKSISKRFLVCLAGTEHPHLSIVASGGCKAPALWTTQSNYNSRTLIL